MAEGIGTGSAATGRLAPTSIGAGGTLELDGRSVTARNIGVIEPSRGLAAGLASVARVADDLAGQAVMAERRRIVAEAGRAGANDAVVRDEAGNLTVRLMESDSFAGRAFNETAEAAYLAELDLDVRRRAAELQRAHRADPDAFAAAWDGYTRGVGSRVPEALRGAATLHIARAGQQAELALLDQRMAEERRLQQDAIAAQQTALQTDMANLATAGRADAPEYAEAAGRFAALLDQEVQAGFISAERATLLAAAQADEDEARGIAFAAVDAYRRAGRGTAGQAAAQSRLEALLADPSLGIPPERRQAIVNTAQARIADEETMRRSQVRDLTTRIAGDMDRLERGYPLPAGRLEAHRAALVAAGEPVLAGEVAQAAALQHELASFARLPLADQALAIAELDGTLRGGGGEAADLVRLDRMQRAAAAKEQALREDPLAWAVEAGVLTELPPLDIGSSESLRASLGARLAAAETVADREGLTTVAPLRPAELDGLKRLLDQSTAGEKAALLDALSGSLPPAYYSSVLAGLAEKNAPILAMAGALRAQSPAAAERVLSGMDTAAAEPKILPKQDARWQAVLSEELGPALGHLPGYMTTAAAATRSAYAALAAEAGDLSGELDEDRLRDAIATVTGGFVRHNRAPLPAPVHGMSQRDFRAGMDRLRDDALGDAATRGRLADGTPITARAIRDWARLIPIGAGRYLVDIDGAAVVDARGLPWELDLGRAMALSEDQAGRVMTLPPPRTGGAP